MVEDDVASEGAEASPELIPCDSGPESEDRLEDLVEGYLSEEEGGGVVAGATLAPVEQFAVTEAAQGGQRDEDW